MTRRRPFQVGMFVVTLLLGANTLADSCYVGIWVRNASARNYLLRVKGSMIGQPSTEDTRSFPAQTDVFINSAWKRAYPEYGCLFWSYTFQVLDGGQVVAQGASSGGISTWNVPFTYNVLGFVFDGYADPTPFRRQGTEAEIKDPFNALSGVVQHDATDIYVPLPGLPLTYHRAYNGFAAGDREFGAGWQASTDWALQTPTNDASILSVSTDMGAIISFAPTNNIWVSRRDVAWEVQREVGSTTNWILNMRTGHSMHFDAVGKWLWTQDQWSNRISGIRDDLGRITNITHTCGRSLRVAWTNNRVAYVEASGSIMRSEYAYSASNQLTGVVWRAASGETRREAYAYDSKWGVLTNTINVLGHQVCFSYAELNDGTVRCTKSAYADGSFAAYADWNGTGRWVTIRYPITLGLTNRETIRPTETWSRIASRESLGRTNVFAYELSTLVQTSVVWFTSNQTARYQQTVDSLGRPKNTSLSMGGATGPVWQTTWLADQNFPATKIDPQGWCATYTWTNGLPASVSQTNGINGGWITSSMVYSQGMLVAVCDALGRVTSMTRDSQGGLASITPPVGPTVTLTNDIWGNPVQRTLPAENGGSRTWLLLRDGFGNLTNAIDPDGLRTIYACDALGQVTNIVDRAGRSTAISYGVSGHPLTVTRHVIENGSSRDVTFHTDYDLQMDPAAVRDGLNRTVESYVRDDLGRVATVTNVEGRVATTTYGVLDLPLSVSRFDGSLVGMAYDGAARLASVTYPDHTNAFAWLANDLPASVSDGATLVTNTWIAPGRLTSQKIQNGNWTGQVSHAFDLVGNMTQTTASCAGSTAASITRNVDAGDRETNRLFSACGATFGFTREYGGWNGLPTKMASADGAIEQRLSWDLLDRLTNVVWRSGTNEVRSIQYMLDVLGQVTQRVDRVGGVETIRAYTYDGLDRLASEAHSDGFAATYSYDDAGRRTAKSSEKFDVAYTPGTGDRLASWTVTRTNWAPVISVTGYSSEAPATNPPYRVLAVSNVLAGVAPTMSGSNFTATLPMEPLGTQTVFAAISDAAGNVGVSTSVFVRTAFTTGAYAGNDAGCVTQIVYQGPACLQTKVLSWDGEYRMKAVQTNGATAESYGYGPDGRRISTTAGDGTVTRHLWDGVHVVADTDATGKVLRAYAYGPNVDELLAIIVQTNGMAETYYTLRDHQNTVWGLVDTNGAAVESYDFDAWGRVLSVKNGSGQVLAQSAVGNRYLFQGREYSWVTGLYYFRARWYDPVVGRWLSPDPIGINGGLNQYAAFGNNPVNRTDPLGTCDHSLDFTLEALGLGTGGSGALVGALENMQNGATGYWIGKNGQLLSTAFNGNQWTGGRLAFAGKMAGVARTAGNAVGGTGIGISFAQGVQAARANNTDGVIQSGIDMTMGGVGYLGPIGWAASTGYFVGQTIDRFTGASDFFAGRR